MSNRILNPSSPQQTQFGLIAWLEQTRVSLPLKGVECRFAVCGELVDVQIDQIFHQNNAQPLDCLYTFPLPGDAAVYRCEMHVNDRVIRARVEELQKARRLAREKKAAGHRTALVEMARDNVFTLSLGNVQPEDVIVVRFAYFQTLSRLENWTSFQIPFCPGIRYIPGKPLLREPKGHGVMDDTDQVPDASRISPPRMDRMHPDAAYHSVEGSIEHPMSNVRDISSPSHPVLVRDGQGSSTVSIADRDCVPDSDFVLRWTESLPRELTATGWVLRHEKASFALIRLIAPRDFEADEQPGQDVYFLVDRSSSMEGMKWAKAVQAFREYLKTMSSKDRAWATFFETEFRDLAEKPLAAAELLTDRAVGALEKLGTTGGTELLPALEHVLKKVTRHSAGRPATLLLITDGQVGNDAEILRLLKQHPNLRVHTFGIDTAVNDALLKRMASQQRGTCYLVTPRDDIAGTVARLGLRLRRPVLTSLRIEGAWQPAHEPMPDLHAGEVLCLPLQGSADASEVRIEGLLPDGTSKSYRIELLERDLQALRLLWARDRINQHLANEKNSAAVALAKQHNLICEGAAFIAWDEHEKVAVSTRELYQPAFEPEMCPMVGDKSFSETRASMIGFSMGGLPKTLGVRAQEGPPTRGGRWRTSMSKLRSSASPPGNGESSDTSSPDFESRLTRCLEGLQDLFDHSFLIHGFVLVIREWVLSKLNLQEDRLEEVIELLLKLDQAPVAANARWNLLRLWFDARVTEPTELRQRVIEQCQRLDHALDTA